jgi:hypothetical protein
MPLAVIVIVPVEDKFTVVLMFPIPLGAPQLDTTDASQDHVTPMIAAGKVSVTTTPLTASGPEFVTKMV